MAVRPFAPVLHSVSYAGVWPGQARLSLDAFLERATRLGFEGVMLMAKRPHLSVLDQTAEARIRLRETCARLHLPVVCLAGYTDFCMGHPHPEVPAREIQLLYVRELCRLARDVGCPLVRLFTGYTADGMGFDQHWAWCVESLRECARYAADCGVTLALQNHHDLAVHFESFYDLLCEIDHPHCRAAFDAWSPALQGDDLPAAVRRLQPFVVHTTVADYVRRPRFVYRPALVNYTREPDDVIRAVPLGEGFIDYRGFFNALKEIGYTGAVAYEMCSALRGGGGEANLDRYARTFLDYLRQL